MTQCVSVAYGYHTRHQRSSVVAGMARYTSGTKTFLTPMCSPFLFLNSTFLAQNVAIFFQGGIWYWENYKSKVKLAIILPWCHSISE